MTPSREAVRRWAQAYADSCQEDEGDRVQRIITLADDAVVAGLHGASHHPEKYIIPANAVAGTYGDKRDRQTGGTINIVALVTERAAQLASAIEGEYRELDDDED